MRIIYNDSAISSQITMNLVLNIYIETNIYSNIIYYMNESLDVLDDIKQNITDNQYKQLWIHYGNK
jgi:hypothetical protein